MSIIVKEYKTIIPNMGESVTNTISNRYKTVTKLINEKFWNINSDTKNSLYVGSYGRGTAISTSDIDILVCLPESEYIHFNTIKGNSQSRLLQAVRQNILSIYPTSRVRADGQVIIIEFSDNIKFEILPAFKNYYNDTYKYPDSNMGGRWLSTRPKIEQEAIKTKNIDTDGLLINTCKYIRYIRDNYFSSYYLSGIVIDSFVYNALAYTYRRFANTYSYHSYLLDHFKTLSGYITTPGSQESISISKSNFCLEKVLNYMVRTSIS